MNAKRTETEKTNSTTENRDDEIKLVVKRMRVRSSVKVGLALTEESGDERDCY